MTDDGTPTARALRTLELLQAFPGITAHDLGERLGVSARAARRYVGMLRDAGIAVESTTGPYGGYRLGRGIRLPPLHFGADEALGLVLAVLDGHHDALDPAHPVGRALSKVLGALPARVAAQAEAVRRTAAPAADRAAAPPDPHVTAAVVDACSEARRLDVAYRTESGYAFHATVDPWAIVVRHARWYLLCFSHTAGAVRTLRVDRITAVAPTDVTFEPPADLDPVAALEENLAHGWEYDVDVVFAAPLEQVQRWLPRTMGLLREGSDSQHASCRLTATTSNPDWYARLLGEVPMEFEIVGGPELHAAARRAAERLLAATRTRAASA